MVGGWVGGWVGRRLRPSGKGPHAVAAPPQKELADGAGRAATQPLCHPLLLTSNPPPVHCPPVGVVCDYGLTLSDLIGVLQQFFVRLGLKKLRFKPAFNPYTEPSMEIFRWAALDGCWLVGRVCE